MRAYYITLVVFAITTTCSNPNSTDLKFERLLCEYSENPINLDIPHPRFSWVVSSSKRGRYQTAYQVIVRKIIDRAERAVIWDSGKVNSDNTLHIVYEDEALQSNTSYIWNVLLWDEAGRRYESEPGSFATALLAENDWQAHWIGANPASEPKPEKGFYMDKNEEQGLPDTVHHNGQSVLLRKEFSLDKPVQSAKLFITGLGFYEAMLNGEKLGNYVLAPAKTPYHKHILYDTYDVAHLLQKGKNAMGIHLGNGWYDPYKKWWKEYRMQWFGYKKALAQLHVTYEDGSEVVIQTDDSWKTTRGPVLYNCVYDGEIYDANKSISGWSNAGFDDSHWSGVVMMDKPKAKILSHLMPPIRVNEIRKPVNITNPMPGMKVYDLGQNFTGWVRLTMKGNKGDTVKIRFSEELYENGTLNYTCNERAKASIEYIMKGGAAETYEPTFTYFGFQYVEVTSSGSLPEITDFEGNVVYSANRTIGYFSCSHELINKMHHATVWSQKSNMLSYPMDCPQRDERLGWMGDAQVTAEEAMFNFDMALFYTNWFRGIRANQDRETGDIPIISPRPYIKDEGVGWSSTFITMVWHHYRYYGDLQVLQENYEAMKKYVDYLGRISTGHIVPKGWIGDWGSAVEGWKEGQPESVSTAYYFYNATIMQKVAGVLSQAEDEIKFEGLAADIKLAYNKAYFNDETKDYNDGSQMANAFPLFLGLVDEENKNAVLENLVHDIQILNDTHLTTGVLGTKYIMDALSLYDRSDVAWALATQTSYPSWAEMMKRFNTMCEFWTLKQSHNHVMMGSIDAWFYKTLAGIQLEDEQPGFKQFIIKPYLAEGLDHVKGSTNTFRGRILSSWEKTENGFSLTVEVPFNCQARVILPLKNELSITESGKPLERVEEIILLQNLEEQKIVQIPSGKYIFAYQK